MRYTVLICIIVFSVYGISFAEDFVPQSQISEVKNNLQGNELSGGLGIVIELSSKGLIIKDVLPNTPASEVDLKKGDIITDIDTTSVKGLSLGEVVNKLRGMVGSTVSLKVLLSGTSEPISIILKREIIKIDKKYANNNPYTVSLPPTNAKEKAQYTYKVEAKDIDEDKVTFKLIECPKGMVIDSNTREISWIPTSEQLGFNKVKIEISDGNGGVNSQEYTLFAVNSWQQNILPQIVSTVPKRIIKAYEEFTYQVKAYNTERGNLKYGFGVRYPENMKINETTGVIDWIPTVKQLGSNTVYIIVTNGDQNSKRFLPGESNCQVIDLVVITDWYKDIDSDGYSDGIMVTRGDRLKGYYLPSELKGTYGDPDDTDAEKKPK